VAYFNGKIQIFDLAYRSLLHERSEESVFLTARRALDNSQKNEKHRCQSGVFLSVFANFLLEYYEYYLIARASWTQGLQMCLPLNVMMFSVDLQIAQQVSGDCSSFFWIVFVLIFFIFHSSYWYRIVLEFYLSINQVLPDRICDVKCQSCHFKGRIWKIV